MLAGPSARHLLGTDPLGRDVFSQIIGGVRISMVVGLLSVAAGLVTGTDAQSCACRCRLYEHYLKDKL